jgi:hypothetical protein
MFRLNALRPLVSDGSEESAGFVVVIEDEPPQMCRDCRTMSGMSEFAPGGKPVVHSAALH